MSVAEYLDPDKEPPPINKNILLLTSNGVCVIGRWLPGGAYIGWLPVPKPTGEMTVKISQAGLGGRNDG